MKALVNGLWIQGELSALELLTIHSYIQNGFTFQLWTYTPDSINPPVGTILKFAGDIIPQNRVFSYTDINKYGHGKGSYAGFSDIFRYKLLHELGGIWTDMDITCLRPFEIGTDYFFRYHHKVGAVGNFMKCPAQSELMKWCYEQAVQKVTAENKDWMLPIEILNRGIQKFELTSNIQKISNNDSFPEVMRLLSGNANLPDEWKIIHWMNEEFRRLNISKSVFLKNSVIEQLLEKYSIPHQTYTGLELIRNRILLSRYWYLLKNIKPTLSWYLLPK